MKNYLDGARRFPRRFASSRSITSCPARARNGRPSGRRWRVKKLDNKAGPTFVESWLETLAVNMATGYTLMTAGRRRKLLHAGVGVLQGSMGIHSAMQGKVPMVVMSGVQTLGEDPDLDIEQQWYGGLTVSGIERYVEPVAKWARRDEPLYAL